MSENNNQQLLKISFELPQVVNKALIPLASKVGDTLSCLWGGIFVGIETWYERKKIEQIHFLESYSKQIQDNLSKIPGGIL